MAATTDGFVDRRAGPAAARPRRLLRHAAGRHADAARRRPAARPGADGRRRGARPRHVAARVTGAGGGRGPESLVRERWARPLRPGRASGDAEPCGSSPGGSRDGGWPAPTWAGLRPTSDRLRETLFNILGAAVRGARVLDGYAGTGARRHRGAQPRRRARRRSSSTTGARGARSPRTCGAAASRRAMLSCARTSAGSQRSPARGRFDLDPARSAVRRARPRPRRSASRRPVAGGRRRAGARARTPRRSRPQAAGALARTRAVQVRRQRAVVLPARAAGRRLGRRRLGASHDDRPRRVSARPTPPGPADGRSTRARSIR